MKTYIDQNIDIVGQGDLSKLATRAKNLLVEIAKENKLDYEWFSGDKVLVFDGRPVHFG